MSQSKDNTQSTYNPKAIERARRRREALGTTVLGFTLLEVMISVAILAMGLSTVFGSNVIAARRVAHARMVTQAALLGQCRMTAVESYVRKNQLPQIDENLDDPPPGGSEACCEAPFTCEAKIEKIELPDPPEVSSAAGADMLSTAAAAMAGSQFGGAPGAGGAAANPLAGLAGALGGLGGAGGAAPGSGAMSGAGGAPDISGIQTQLLTSIYPTLKPLLEGAIRKVTVRVVWNEGSRENSISIVQYVTNPGQTIQSGDAMPAIPGAAGGAGGAAGGLGGLGGLLGGAGGAGGLGGLLGGASGSSGVGTGTR